MPETPLAVRTRKFSSLLLTLGLSSTIFLKLQHRTLLLVGPVAAEIFGPHPKNCCFTDPGYGLRISVSKRFSGYSCAPCKNWSEGKEVHQIQYYNLSTHSLEKFFFFEQYHQFFSLSSSPICCPTSSNFPPLLVLSLSSHLHHGAYSVA